MSIGQHVRHYQAKKQASERQQRYMQRLVASGRCRCCGAPRPPTLALHCRACAAKRNAHATPKRESFAYFCAQQGRKIRRAFAHRDLQRRGLTTRGEPRERHERTQPSDFEITMRGNCQGGF